MTETNEVPHADLIARLRAVEQATGVRSLYAEAADALAALGDTVPREQYDQVCAMHDASAQSARDFWQRVEKSERERDEARAERDLIAQEVKRTPHASWCVWQEETRRHIGKPCDCYLADAIEAATAPAVSLALHDAEVKAQALDEAAEAYSYLENDDYAVSASRLLRDRATAIREEAANTIKENK